MVDSESKDYVGFAALNVLPDETILFSDKMKKTN